MISEGVRFDQINVLTLSTWRDKPAQNTESDQCLQCLTLSQQFYTHSQIDKLTCWREVYGKGWGMWIFRVNTISLIYPKFPLKMKFWVNGGLTEPLEPTPGFRVKCYYMYLGNVIQSFLSDINLIELQHQKTYLRACAPSEDSDQPAHSLENCIIVKKILVKLPRKYRNHEAQFSQNSKRRRDETQQWQNKCHI